MYLAIGIVVDPDAFTWSVEVDSDNPQEVAQNLFNVIHQTPDQILLVVNGQQSPDVYQHWNVNREYKEIESATNPPSWCVSDAPLSVDETLDDMSMDDFAKEDE